MHRACRSFRYGLEPQTLALIPTMGALHEGHMSLIREARKHCDHVAATIFVNPLQFGPNEDFVKYPRSFDADCAALTSEGVDLLFAPPPEEMYPAGAEAQVEVPLIGARLDGTSRPGHFRGVTTVVTKLFHIVQQDKAFFGQKDTAQVAVLRVMVRDLNFDTEIFVCPTVREEDGLTLSSRNRYLNPSERQRALALSRSLRYLQHAVATGQHGARPLLDTLLQHLHSVDALRVDYAAIVDPQTLEPLDDVRSRSLVAIAAWVGDTRLIDNILLTPQTSQDAIDFFHRTIA